MVTEFLRRPLSGWVMLPTLLTTFVGVIGGFIWHLTQLKTMKNPDPMWFGVLAGFVLAMLVLIILLCGFFTLQPNEAAALLLFGKYKGSVRAEGFHWANPFLTKLKVSLRARTLNGEKLKVNDQRGNPIEIAAVVVWSVKDTAQACFDVQNYEEYVAMQSETAVRHLASAYPYDGSGEHELSLRGSMDEVSQALKAELHQRLTKAGVVVEEARLSHLAYAPEIAGAMLRRQQAEAVVAARMRIVEGAVGMVELALQRLETHKTVELDEERKAAMVSNLLVVLCGEQAAQPIVNTGTLYT